MLRKTIRAIIAFIFSIPIDVLFVYITKELLAWNLPMAINIAAGSASYCVAYFVIAFLDR